MGSGRRISSMRARPSCMCVFDLSIHGICKFVWVFWVYSHESESSEVQFREFRRKYSAGCIRRVLAATRSFFVPP